MTALLICSFVSCSIRGYAFYSHICVCICICICIWICICICIYICICVCFCICYCILQVVRYRLYSHIYVSVFGYAMYLQLVLRSQVYVQIIFCRFAEIILQHVRLSHRSSTEFDSESFVLQFCLPMIFCHLAI